MERPIGVVIQELHRRAQNGFRHAPFTVAFWAGLVVAGGLGVWVEIYNLAIDAFVDPAHAPLDALRTAISTFFPAVIGATSLQMAYEDELKANRGLAVALVLILLIAFVMMADRRLSDWVAFPLGIGASGISLWTWCAANGNSSLFQEMPIDAPIGDLPLDAPLSGGDDLVGLKH